MQEMTDVGLHNFSSLLYLPYMYVYIVYCRIYMKFHARRMQEMTDVGLHNFSSLFISLAAVTDLQDVVSSSMYNNI